MPNLLQIMKQASSDAFEEGKPVNLVYGTVQNTNPLEILVEQKLLLEEPFLVCARNVTNYDVEMEMLHETELSGAYEHSHSVSTSGGSGTTNTNREPAHKHEYKGKKKYRVLNGLQSGEKVIMIRMQGGQRFIVLDRIG
ncbi:DUF2577 domain-containing protein [Sinanaerobacter sp. ZZT-01]|uniref:DUF2577 domain-containing protein n=1 Tax=Sinanaerobacter sp. ZZT-01 TaxID=3111540 RepID=UPI002D795666|nr:DUF2577 domain-containing protein [Sinanaerobacter sp. ZZT-01]WRR94086.1 DUF2577 domain-containing protein [Sinanaerobacter sp. ZZT-01]